MHGIPSNSPFYTRRGYVLAMGLPPRSPPPSITEGGYDELRGRQWGDVVVEEEEKNVSAQYIFNIEQITPNMPH
jgi:hypothetical protein